MTHGLNHHRTVNNIIVVIRYNIIKGREGGRGRGGGREREGEREGERERRGRERVLTHGVIKQEMTYKNKLQLGMACVLIVTIYKQQVIELSGRNLGFDYELVVKSIYRIPSLHWHVLGVQYVH